MRPLPEKDGNGLRGRMRGSMCILDVFGTVILAKTQNGTRRPEIAKVLAGSSRDDVIIMHAHANCLYFGEAL